MPLYNVCHVSACVLAPQRQDVTVSIAPTCSASHVLLHRLELLILIWEWDTGCLLSHGRCTVHNNQEHTPVTIINKSGISNKSLYTTGHHSGLVSEGKFAALPRAACSLWKLNNKQQQKSQSCDNALLLSTMLTGQSLMQHSVIGSLADVALWQLSGLPVSCCVLL